MSKFQINVKSSNYARDKETFLKDLKQFNESKGIPFKTPNVNGVDIDLYLFYSLVQQRGGLTKVNQTDALDTFLRPLRLPHPCINGSTLLRKIYGTYLEKYERARGPPGRDDDDAMEDDFRRSRGGGMPRVTFSGAYITDSSRQSRSSGPPERLALSLLSPMPNEQDFAVNVCSVLAADLANRLPLSSTPHILDFLLAHAGVYNHESLRTTIGRSYYEARGVYPDQFWKQRAGGGGARELADETRFSEPGLEQPELMVQALAAQNTLTDCLTMDAGCRADIEKIILEPDASDDWVTEPSEEDQLFAPQFPGGSKCVYTQRVLQIASIVRSLSFHEENVPLLARNTTLLRFLLLCANSWVGTLRQSGLDTLGNISTELVIKEPATCLISRHVLSTIQAAMVSTDRARVLAGLELLNKLAQNENNEDILLKALELKVYEEVCALLTLRDIMVLVCTLECVYALTSLGERACECVAKVRGLVSTLVSLVTVEAQSYGPRACILMRVVETVSGPTVQQTDDRPHTTAQPAAPQAAPPTQVTPTKVEPRPQAQPTPAAVPSVSQAPVVVPSIQQQHLQQQQLQENEQFALAWLRASYEPLPANNNSGVEASDVYRQYVACCTKMSRKGMLSSAHIPRLIRTLFGGSVGPNTVTTSTGETQQMYVGIRCRNPPPRNAAGPSSPILKAQLTNKTGTTEVKAVVQQPQSQQVTTHPPFSQAIDAGSSTTLIKHLLANKVSPAPHVNMQVAQRQQNQLRVVGQSNTVVVQQASHSQAMEVDPEALIKCTTITPGGVASSTPIQTDKIVTSSVIQSCGEEGKEEPVQIQIDEQSQLTIKTSQNKMLADLLEKKSNPPVQVVQMTPQQLNAPTIQITETGQIVQVKPDSNPVIQINPDILQMKTDSSPVLQINPETGQISQIMQIKSESGPMIQITPESQMLPQPGSYIQVKNDQGQIIHLKNDQGQIIQIKGSITEQFQHGLKNDAGGDEPPNKKIKVEEKREKSPQESVSKTAANLYAALAASALEDEEDLMPPKQEDVIQQPVQEPILQVQQPTMQVQQPTLQVQAPTLQVQQPMLQVQPMDMQVQNIIASQGGQLILQEKPMSSQQGQFVQQQMQLIATPNTSQGGLSYITQNIPGNMMQPHKTIIIVQGASTGGPITLTVNNPGGIDESTLNSLITQATEAITQQQVIQNAPQLTASQQPIITTQPQPHKAQLVNQGQLVLTQKQPQLVTSTSHQQIIGSSPQYVTVSGNQQIIVNASMKQNVHRVVQAPRTQASQPTMVADKPNVNAPSTVAAKVQQQKPQPVMRQVITRQPVMIGTTKIGEKEVIVHQAVTETTPPPLTPTSNPPSTPAPPPTQPPPQPPPQPIKQDDTPWICHWKGCAKIFDSATAVYSHAAKSHVPTSATGESPCLWLDCDRVPRRSFALLNHLHDRHCTVDALKAIFISRKNAAVEAEANKPVSLGYPPNAAMAALNKHAVDFLNPRELMDENEGPVTKSIRLTAALILRNIVIYSNTGRRQLRSYEPHLASIALSSVEASRTIAQVLYDMNNI